MSNSFSKEERVLFEDLLEAFNDTLVLSRNVSKFGTDGTLMERTNDVIWRPQPYIMQTFDGMDQTLNFQDATQLSVPAALGYQKSSPWIMDALEMRDALQEGRLYDGAKQKLASDINTAVYSVARLQGTLVVAVSGASGQYDDVALAETMMNEQGVPTNERYLALTTRDYNGLAGDLAIATRSFGNSKSDSAYERSYVGPVANFETYKMDTAARIAAAGGGATNMDTQAAALNYYVPRATSTAATGETSNVDNRYQTVTVDNTVGIVAGDAFTVAGITALHHITKEDTGQPKTFRVIEVLTATTMVISPPIISNQGGSDAEAQYQNVAVAASASAAFNWLNDNATSYNCFWQRDAIELLPGRYAVPTDAGAAIMRGTTDNGIELVLQKQYDINTMKTKFRVDTLFGVCMKQPEMAGILLWNQ